MRREDSAVKKARLEHELPVSSPVEEARIAWPGLEVVFSREDIRSRSNWRIRESRHTVIVHLGGQMHQLETEMEGHGGSRGAAMPGEIWSIPAGRRYAGQALGGCIFYAVIFLDPAAPSLLTGAGTSSFELMPTAAFRDEFLHQTVLRLRKVVGMKDDLSRILGESLGQSICLHLARPSGGRDRFRLPSPPSLSEDLARRLRDFVFDHLGEAMTLDSLAEMAGMTPHHLLIAFRRAFGTTPGQYILRQRLRAAQRLLASTRRDITSVALETGFSSHSHLTGAFRRCYGLTPREVRRTGMNPLD